MARNRFFKSKLKYLNYYKPEFDFYTLAVNLSQNIVGIIFTVISLVLISITVMEGWVQYTDI
jgi:hypothetical protein